MILCFPRRKQQHRKNIAQASIGLRLSRGAWGGIPQLTFVKSAHDEFSFHINLRPIPGNKSEKSGFLTFCFLDVGYDPQV